MITAVFRIEKHPKNIKLFYKREALFRTLQTVPAITTFLAVQYRKSPFASRGFFCIELVY